MNCNFILDYLNENFIEYQLDAKLSEYTTFKIGGAAGAVVYPSKISEIVDIIRLCEKNSYGYFILGNGSNLLVSDNKIDKIFISTKKLNSMSVYNDEITCMAGASLSSLANFAYENSLSGLEFAKGIPGSVGGAVYMNAGAYDGEIADVVVKTIYLEDGKIKEVLYDEHMFGYRTSVFKNTEKFIISSVFRLRQGDKEKIAEKMHTFMLLRKEKQPLELPSAGSTFKRPEGYFAGKLIDDAGLRGFSIGNAGVSTKHCGFIVNNGGATFDQVKSVIEHVQSTVYDKFSVKLECEVEFVE